MTHLAIFTELPGGATEVDVTQSLQNDDDAFAIPADSFARAVAFAISRPEEADINEIWFRPMRHEL